MGLGGRKGAETPPLFPPSMKFWPRRGGWGRILRHGWGQCLWVGGFRARSGGKRGVGMGMGLHMGVAVMVMMMMMVMKVARAVQVPGGCGDSGGEGLGRGGRGHWQRAHPGCAP